MKASFSARDLSNAVMGVVNNATDAVQSFVGAIGDGIKGAWNSIGPGQKGGGFTLSSENGGVTGGTDQGVKRRSRGRYVRGWSFTNTRYAK